MTFSNRPFYMDVPVYADQEFTYNSSARTQDVIWMTFSKWNRNTNNKLFQVKPFWGEWCAAFRKSWKEQVTMTRLRIGHNRLTHSFILKQEQQPQCSTGQTPCTIKHVFLESKVFNDTRKHYFHANTIKDLFENIHMDNVLLFLKETGLYQKI